MPKAIDDYLNRVLAYADRDPSDEPAIRDELRGHLEDKVEALRAQGMPSEDAVYQAIRDAGSASVVGYGLRPRFAWIDVRSEGTARGVIAIGPRAVGVFAMGGIAVGVFAFGGVAIGVISIGALAVGLLATWAMIGVGLISYGGLAIGLLAMGGVALGIAAFGQFAVGIWARGGRTWMLADSIDSLPAWLEVEQLLDGNRHTWLLLFLCIFWIAAFALSAIAQHREKRRVEKRLTAA